LDVGRRHFLSCLGLTAAGAAGASLKAAFGRQNESPPGPGPAGAGWDAGPIHRNPVEIGPAGDDLADLVPDDCLRRLLADLAPSWYAFKTARALHAFRLWGPEAVFPSRLFTHPFEGRVFSGAELAAYLLDHRAYRRIAPGDTPLLLRTPYGVRVRTYSAGVAGTFAGELAHNDDLLTACGEVGLSADTAVYTAEGEAQVRDLVRESVARFTIRQELEWTAEAFARYLAPRRSWVNRFGEAFSFDAVAAALLAKTPGQGACLGTHVPYALTCLYRVSANHPILSPRTRLLITRRLQEMSLLLVAARQGEGHWAGRWAPGVRPFLSGPAAEAGAAVVATGHHLEWVALAPPECRPPRDVIGNAVRGAFALLRNLTTHDRSQSYLELSHLARALCLMKNRSAVDIVRGW
jgi:hypothetical protein